ncbi:YARHG domain-containing protein [Neobacillus sp. MER 74]|uniref:YARHG domain-containing protein n=1 Tax=Neobacillus sp. MER 74 TaxID=2939566 RepID=UPI00203FD429|nr:YARHG domain-containing protein [Neobacillus sp. MER 74]MCM3117557.1 YARHG domain-containing protein [Neobacillus sp. MER 74]
MDVCTNCGEELNPSSKFCPNCGSKVAIEQKNMPSTLETRIEIKKNRSKTRLLAGVGTLIGLMLAISVTLIVKDFSKPELKSNAAVTKTVDRAKDKDVEKKDQVSHETEQESSNPPSSEYILPASDKKVLGEADVANLTKGQLRIARNEIYARHGYVFQSEDLQTYFSSKSWYQQEPDFDGSLNEVEKENINFIKEREDSL